MNWTYSQIIKWFATSKRAGFNDKGVWGLEKESHRVNAQGELSLTDHPLAFGDKLENEQITVDFAESQLELITPPLQSIEETLQDLARIHDEVDAELGQELLWPFSMPPQLPEEDQIRLATFNDSKRGRESELYRKSLSVRYGTKMQMISGLHCNYSFSPQLIDTLYERWGSGDKQTFVDRLYMAVARNFLRYRWLLIYLYGASPVVDETYQSVVDQELELFRDHCPECAEMLDDSLSYATSLRVSRFGYSNTVQKTNVSFNSLRKYTGSMKRLLNTPSETFKHIGLYRDGERIQINENVLQRESEFYSALRLKTKMSPDEIEVDALSKRGVQYMEIRMMDLNPFERVGVNADQLQFLHLFLLFCLFQDSPPISDEECEIIHENHHRASLLGRMPDFKLLNDRGHEVAFEHVAEQVFESMAEIAQLLDDEESTDENGRIVKEQYEKCQDREKLPSAIIISEMKKNKESFIQYGTRMAKRYKGVACR